MNILQVISIFDHPRFYGGSRQVAYQISRELVKRGHNVTVYSSDLRNDLRTRHECQAEEIDGIRAVYFKCSYPVLAKNLKFFITPSMREGLQKESYDVVHLHEVRSYQHILVNQLSKKNNFPYIVQAHGILEVPRGFTRRFYDLICGDRILREAAKLIALNLHEADAYRRIGAHEDKITVLPNGIDLSEYVEIPPKGSFKKKFNIKEDKKIVLYLGRIHIIKGIDVLAKAYSYAVKNLGLRNTFLIIVGPDDGYLHQLEQLLNSLKENSILLIGPLYSKDKLEAYVDANVFVLPSRYETFPNVILEAYACSKPVIASGIMSIPDIVINGRTGLLFQAGDEKELAEKIVYMLTHAEESEAMGKEARKLVEENFSIDKVVDSLELLYENVTKKSE